MTTSNVKPFADTQGMVKEANINKTYTSGSAPTNLGIIDSWKGPMNSGR